MVVVQLANRLQQPSLRYCIKLSRLLTVITSIDKLRLMIENVVTWLHYHYKSMHVYNEDGVWNATLCDTHGFTPNNDGTAVVHCDCESDGFVAVFLLNSDNSLVLLPEQFSFRKAVTFK